MPKSQIFNMANMSFNVICENKKKSHENFQIYSIKVGLYQPASEMPFKWHFAGGPIVA